MAIVERMTAFTMVHHLLSPVKHLAPVFKPLDECVSIVLRLDKRVVVTLICHWLLIKAVEVHALVVCRLANLSSHCDWILVAPEGLIQKVLCLLVLILCGRYNRVGRR